MSPGCSCIVKGKEHKKYGVGNKVSVIRSDTGIILGVMSFRNEYDGHTIEPSLAQVERLTGRKIKVPAGDRGYESGFLRDDYIEARNTKYSPVQ